MKKTIFSILFGLVCCFMFEAKGVVVLDFFQNVPAEEDVFSPVDQMMDIACEKIRDAYSSYRRGDYIKMANDIGIIGGVALVSLPFMYISYALFREQVHTCVETSGVFIVE